MAPTTRCYQNYPTCPQCDFIYVGPTLPATTVECPECGQVFTIIEHVVIKYTTAPAVEGTLL